jgi:hypothetical protein
MVLGIFILTPGTDSVSFFVSRRLDVAVCAFVEPASSARDFFLPPSPQSPANLILIFLIALLMYLTCFYLDSVSQETAGRMYDSTAHLFFI